MSCCNGFSLFCWFLDVLLREEEEHRRANGKSQQDEEDGYEGAASGMVSTEGHGG